MIISPDDISVVFVHSSADEEDDEEDDDEDLMYNCYTDVHAEIRLKQQQQGFTTIGTIGAILVDRQRIPEHCFFESFDEHSREMEWIGCTILENRYGRTQLQSLAYYDDPEFDFMYIDEFNIDDEYKIDGDSEVGAIALCKFLHDPLIKGDLDFGVWRVSSAVYVLDPCEAMTPQDLEQHQRRTQERQNWLAPEQSAAQRHQEEQRLNTLARADANQFLRNGFFQDPALARNGGRNSRILVATYGQWQQPMISHAQAAAIQFCAPPPVPTGADAELAEAVLQSYRAAKNERRDLNAAELAQLGQNVSRHVAAGGSLVRSNALHAAVANNMFTVVQYILQTEHSAIDSTNSSGMTPLMVAAESVIMRSNLFYGMAETRVIDLLLAAGASKTLRDSSTGMTAYGFFRSRSEGISAFMDAANVLLTKLYPTAGPSPGDLSGGKGGTTDFVDYSQEDAENDHELEDAEDTDDDDDGGEY